MQNLSNFDLESIYSDDPTDAIKKILDSYADHLPKLGNFGLAQRHVETKVYPEIVEKRKLSKAQKPSSSYSGRNRKYELLQKREKDGTNTRIAEKMEKLRKHKGIEKREFYDIKDFVDSWCKRPFIEWPCVENQFRPNQNKNYFYLNGLYRRQILVFRAQNGRSEPFAVCRGTLSSYDAYGNIYLTNFEEVLSFNKLIDKQVLLKYLNHMEQIPVYDKTRKHVKSGVYKRNGKTRYFNKESISEICISEMFEKN